MPRLMETMKFPKYKHKPYPRWVTAPDGKTRVKVKDEREELEVAQRPAKSEEKVSAEAAERQQLIEAAHKAQNAKADADAKLAQALDQIAALQAQVVKAAAAPAKPPTVVPAAKAS